MKPQLIRAKLCSQQGASILFALFFFIVCAVIGSIVLTAATAAAGRLEGVKERNQRYYAVNSAADVLAHEMDNPEMKVVKTVSKRTTVTVNGSQVSDDTETDPALPDYGISIAKLLYDNPGGDVNLRLSHGTNDLLNAEIRKIINYSTADDQLSLDNPPATGQPAPTNDYNRRIQICSTDRQYSLILDCPAHIDRRQSVKTSASVTVENGIRKETVTTTTTTKYTITWSVASVVKGGPVS